MRSELLPDGFHSRTARKEHQCYGDGSVSHRHADDCPKAIVPGMGSIEYYVDTPAYQSGSRITTECYRRWWLHAGDEAADDACECCHGDCDPGDCPGCPLDAALLDA
jgi:hypothetical protein